MDKKILVTEIKRVIDAFKEEDKVFSFIGLIPVYPGIESTSYILLVNAVWIQELPYHQSISLITHKLFDVLDSKVIRYINRVEIYNENTFNHYPYDLELEDFVGLQNHHNIFLASQNLMNLPK